MSATVTRGDENHTRSGSTRCRKVPTTAAIAILIRRLITKPVAPTSNKAIPTVSNTKAAIVREIVKAVRSARLPLRNNRMRYRSSRLSLASKPLSLIGRDASNQRVSGLHLARVAQL